MMKKFIILVFFIGFNLAQAGCYDKVELNTIYNKVYRCKDGTISFDQRTLYGTSAKDKKNDYEGMCGPTAAANVFHAYCENYFIEPRDIAKKYFNDITPGVRPDTMKEGLNDLFDNNNECLLGEWKYYYSTNRWDFLGSLKNSLRNKYTYWTRTRDDGTRLTRAPIPVLISKQKSGKVLHWVTVVDIIGYYSNDSESYESKNCKVIYNDMGNQHSSSCEKFVNYAHQVDNHTLTGWLPEYIHIVFEPSSFNEFNFEFKKYQKQFSKKN